MMKRRLALIGILLLAVPGCGQDGRRAVTRSNLKTIAILAHQFEERHGRFPDSLAELQTFNPMTRGLLLNPRTGDEPGYEYVKPPRPYSDRGATEAGNSGVSERPRWSEIPIVYELKAGQRDLTGHVSQADGQVVAAQ